VTTPTAGRRELSGSFALSALEEHAARAGLRQRENARQIDLFRTEDTCDTRESGAWAGRRRWSADRPAGRAIGRIALRRRGDRDRRGAGTETTYLDSQSGCRVDEAPTVSRKGCADGATQQSSFRSRRLATRPWRPAVKKARSGRSQRACTAALRRPVITAPLRQLSDGPDIWRRNARRLLKFGIPERGGTEAYECSIGRSPRSPRCRSSTPTCGSKRSSTQRERRSPIARSVFGQAELTSLAESRSLILIVVSSLRAAGLPLCWR